MVTELQEQPLGPESESASQEIVRRIVTLDLDQPLPELLARDEQGRRYPAAQCLVRLHRIPLGVVELAFAQDRLTPADYLPRIWSALREPILAHLREDGLEPIERLEPGGLRGQELPACLRAREAGWDAL